MPALPLTSEQKADAARLKGIYVTKNISQAIYF